MLHQKTQVIIWYQNNRPLFLVFSLICQMVIFSIMRQARLLDFLPPKWRTDALDRSVDWECTLTRYSQFIVFSSTLTKTTYFRSDWCNAAGRWSRVSRPNTLHAVLRVLRWSLQIFDRKPRGLSRQPICYRHLQAVIFLRHLCVVLPPKTGMHQTLYLQYLIHEWR